MMAQEAHTNPIYLLQEIEKRSRANAHELPQQEDIKEGWSGIGFRVDDQNLLAPVGEVREILTFPSISPVPGSKSWVLGIANVRGNLLPIMDLVGYLDGYETTLTKRSRVMVINYRGVFAGLLVDEVLGLKHFDTEERVFELPATEVSLVPYLDRAFCRDSVYWAVFSFHKLALNPLFMQVAV